MTKLPVSLEAERNVLGGIMIDTDILDRVKAWIATEDAFSTNAHRKIWRAILSLEKDNVIPDSISVYNKIGENNGIEPEYLIKLQEEYIENSDILHHSKIVWQRHLQRQTMIMAEKLKNAAHKGFDEIEPLMLRHQKYMEELYNLQPHKDKSIDIVVKEAAEHIKSGDNLIRYNIPFMDDFAGGMTRGEITSLGGRPGHGKTTLMLNIASALAAQGLSVAIFNREMTNAEAIKKMLVSESNGELRYSQLRNRNIPDSTKSLVDKYSQKLIDKYPTLRLYDNIEDLESTITEIKRFEPDVFMDDYIQLIKVRGKKRDRRFEIEDIMHEYKWVVKRTKSAAFLTSQLSREIEKRIDQVPVMSDYAEGATIEHESEACAFIWYPYNFNSIDNPPNKAEFIVKKARYGRVGTYNIGFSGERCKFYETMEEAL